MSSRIMRLTGDGTGGVPLADAFRVVVERLLDHGSARFSELQTLIQNELAYKETRIFSGFYKTWGDFTTDILDQISGIDDGRVPTIAVREGIYFLPGETAEGEHVAIRNPEIKYSVFREATRQANDRDAQYLMTVRSVLAEHERLEKLAVDETVDPFVRDMVERATGSLTAAAKVLSGGKSPREAVKPVVSSAGTLKVMRGSRASGVPGQFPWARDWLKSHPGQFMRSGDLRDLYADNFGYDRESVSSGSINNGLVKLAQDPSSPVVRLEDPVRYGWEEAVDGGR
jgi:hypothetical protein